MIFVLIRLKMLSCEALVTRQSIIMQVEGVSVQNMTVKSCLNFVSLISVTNKCLQDIESIHAIRTTLFLSHSLHLAAQTL